MLDWNGLKKPATLLQVLQTLADEGVETEEELKTWLLDAANHPKLAAIKGVGPKTIDYMKLLVGIPAVAIDVHLLHFLKDAGVTAGNYDEARGILSAVATLMNRNPSDLDYSIWKYMSKRKDDLP